MALQAVLTVGWRDDPAAADAALQLFAAATRGEGDLDARLRATLARERPARVQGLDRLFRLRVGGFERVSAMAAALSDYAAGETGHLYCQVDAFAYAFLKAAKNFDLLVPEVRTPPPEAAPASAYREVLPAWTGRLTGLREFERVGAEIAAAERDAYLALRSIVARPSARDERRALTGLLVSGPSAADEIAGDLGISPNLAVRVLRALAGAGAATDHDGVFTVPEAALPTVIFCLNATMGMDYLAILEAGG